MSPTSPTPAEHYAHAARLLAQAERVIPTLSHSDAAVVKAAHITNAYITLAEAHRRLAVAGQLYPFTPEEVPDDAYPR